ncbi:MAG: FecR domain-containing protein [Alphaproteobacteria bacterium]|nr:FecR domain-containing protein [Alphaproteobacteria bacterium]
MSLLFRGLQGAILMGVVCALMIAANPSPAAAQGISSAAAVAGAVSGTPEGQKVLRQYLSQFSGRPEQMEKKTGDLIKALGKSKIAADPIALQGAITSISQASRQALFATPIAGVKMTRNFRLSPRSIGFDFGSPDSNTMANFQHVTATDKRLTGKNRRALRRPSRNDLLSDGVVNVQKFTADIPNGKWRVVLLTDNLGIGKNLQNPLGKEVKINGKGTKIAQTSPAQWLSNGVLSGHKAELARTGRNLEKALPEIGAQASLSGDSKGDGETSGPPSVGRADNIVAVVRGELPTKTRYLSITDRVFSNEKISTDTSSAVRLIFLDNSIISIGANSSVTLDKFVFDPSGRKSRVALSLSKGVMRFVTGNLSKERYSIRTPTATMGIRGTILEITVASNGTTTTSVVEGEASVNSAGQRRTVRSGFSTTVVRGKPPTPPKAIPPARPQVKAMKTALGAEPDLKKEAEKAEIQGSPAESKKPVADDVGSGGMIIIEAEVVDGKLIIDLGKLGGDSTYLTAIIVEPADEESNLDLREEVKEYYEEDGKRLAATNAKIDEQIGAVLSEIATAAGPQQIAEALGIEKSAKEPNLQASPN